MLSSLLALLLPGCTLHPLEMAEVESDFEPGMIRAGELCVAAGSDLHEAVQCALADRRPWRLSTDPRPPLRLGVVDPEGRLLEQPRKPPVFSPDEAQRRTQAFVPLPNQVRYETDDLAQGLGYAATLFATSEAYRGVVRALRDPKLRGDDSELPNGRPCFDWFVRATPAMPACEKLVLELGGDSLHQQLGRLQAGVAEGRIDVTEAPRLEQALADCALGR